jgi:hypothetical protein
MACGFRDMVFFKLKIMAIHPIRFLGLSSQYHPQDFVDHGIGIRHFPQ